MMEIINNYVERALSRLPEQYKESTKLKKVIEAKMNHLQEIENVLYEFMTKHSISTAENSMLDICGSIVGEPRNYRQDEEYRAAIYTRIGINMSGGDPDSIIRAIQKIVKPIDIDYHDEFPAGFRLYVQHNSNIDLKSLIKSIKPAGVNFAINTLQSTGKAFVFSETSVEPRLLLLDIGRIYGADRRLLSMGNDDVLLVLVGGTAGDKYGFGLAEVFMYTRLLTISANANNPDEQFLLDVGNGFVLELDISPAINEYEVGEGGELIEVIEQ